MIRIGICDDMKVFADMTARICEDTMKQTSMKYEVLTFNDGKEVLEYENKIDLLVLDVEMPGVNGIEVKEKLQQEDSDTLIIFSTCYEHYMSEAFGVNVLGFVAKDKMEENLPGKIMSAIDIINKNILIDGMYESKKVHYIKSEKEYCSLCFGDMDQHVLVKMTLMELEELLAGSGFLRVHKSYLVNLKWVKMFWEKKMYVADAKIPIARRRWKEVNDKWVRYNLSTMRY